MILVTGGAGYIGSHAVKELIKNDFEVAVLDNLSTGHRAAVPPEAAFYEADLLDAPAIKDIFMKVRPRAVMHFAAKSIVSESVISPVETFRVNLGGTLNLLDSMHLCGTGLLVFSSTAAVYGEPERIPIDENHPLKPTNPYGESKLYIENILSRSADAGVLSYISLRYFNAAGADFDGTLGEDHSPETHLIPIILAVAGGKKDKLMVYGNDYPTPDGTPVRDYIHIGDLVSAHTLSLDALLKNKTAKAVYNLGNGRGYSVLEVIDAAERVTGKNIPHEFGPRRDGDPSVLVAGSEKAGKELNWKPLCSDISGIIETAWKWHSKYPYGFS